MTIWHQFTPVDTLFFRGSEPLEAGQPSRDTLFPPPVSVLQGALRTAVLKQRRIAFAEYKANRCPNDILEQIGACGQPAPFQVTAILLARRDTVYVPCPANWFVEAGPSVKGKRPSLVGRTILRAALPDPAAASLIPHSSAGTDLPMVRAVDAQPLAGYWLRLDCLHKPSLKIIEGDLLAAGELYDVEPRTGIAIDGKRKVKQGAIYLAGHIRLRQDVSLVVGIDRDLGLSEKGFLTLGGEQRMCGYVRCQAPDLPDRSASLFVALAPVELTAEVLPAVFAAAKPVTLAGWDLAAGFHKATTTWLPAGAVFNRNVNSLCIPLV